MLDNLNATIDSSSLAMALTSSEYQDRKFGSNTTTITVQNRTVFLATANNPTQSAEIARRMILCRIIPGVADPSQRDPDAFKWKLPTEGIARKRELTAALLVMVENWLACDRPRGRLRMGSFQAWADAVDGILRCAGVEELGANRAQLVASSAGALEMELFVSNILAPYVGQALSAQKICDLAEEAGALADIRGPGNERAQATRLGKELRRYIDRVVGGFRLTTTPTRSGTGYRIERV
jgi:hypothetical protein